MRMCDGMVRSSDHLRIQKRDSASAQCLLSVLIWRGKSPCPGDAARYSGLTRMLSQTHILSLAGLGSTLGLSAGTRWQQQPSCPSEDLGLGWFMWAVSAAHTDQSPRCHSCMGSTLPLGYLSLEQPSAP